jgi:hypothetical protein
MRATSIAAHAPKQCTTALVATRFCPLMGPLGESLVKKKDSPFFSTISSFTINLVNHSKLKKTWCSMDRWTNWQEIKVATRK